MTLHHRSRAVANGYLNTVFCGKQFWNFFLIVLAGTTVVGAIAFVDNAVSL